MASSKIKAINPKHHVDVICRYADQNGLPAPALIKVLGLITSPAVLDQQSQNALLQIMYPAEMVSDHIIHTIVSSLGPGKIKASNTTQQTLVKWILLIYDVLESPRVLSHLYSVLFNLLDCFYLRLHLCHLLVRITRKKHVKPHRIEILKKLEKSIAKDPNLMKVISAFENIVPGSFDDHNGKQVISFGYPDRQWDIRLREIWLRSRVAFPSGGLVGDSINYGHRRSDIGPPHSEEGRMESPDFDNLDGVVNKLEKITITRLSPHDLHQRIISSYLRLRPQSVNSQQVDEMLVDLIDQQTDDLEEDEGLRQDLLDSLSEYASSYKVLPRPDPNFACYNTKREI